MSTEKKITFRPQQFKILHRLEKIDFDLREANRALEEYKIFLNRFGDNIPECSSTSDHLLDRIRTLEKKRSIYLARLENCSFEHNASFVFFENGKVFKATEFDPLDGGILCSTAFGGPLPNSSLPQALLSCPVVPRSSVSTVEFLKSIT